MVMIRFSVLTIPVSAGALAALTTNIEFWDGSKQGLIAALSVFAAAILVRLARAWPFTNPDHYEVSEVRQLAKAIDQINRSLKGLITIIIVNLISIMILKSAYSFFSVNMIIGVAPKLIPGVLIFVIAFMFCYVLVRVIQVVQGDIVLTSMQSKFIVRAVERKNSTKFEDKYMRSRL